MAAAGSLAVLFAGAGQSVKLGWHRDTDRRQSCSFQAPLRPGDCFHELVPGTHGRPLTAPEAAARVDPQTPMPGAIRIPLEPGDLLLRHAKILHQGHNPQGGERRTLGGITGRDRGQPVAGALPSCQPSTAIRATV